MKTIPNKGNVPNGGFLVSCDKYRIIYEDNEYLVVKRVNKTGIPWYTRHVWRKFFKWGYWSNLDAWSATKKGVMRQIELEKNPLDLDKILNED